MNRELLLIAIIVWLRSSVVQPEVACSCVDLAETKTLRCEPAQSGITPGVTGIHDEDDYWSYIRKEFSSYFPGQLIDRTQYNRRKKNLSA